MRVCPRLAAALLATAVTAAASACGGAPDDADLDDFCSAYIDIPDEVDGEGSPSEVAAATREYGEGLEEVGTPEEIDGEAREGFERLVAFLDDLDADDVEEYGGDIDDITRAMDDDDAAQVDALGYAVEDVC